TAADLAIARARFPLDPVAPALEALVGEARATVYDAVGRRQSVVDFAKRGYWRRVAERPMLLALAAVLTFGPVAATVTWAVRDPGKAGAVVPVLMKRSPVPVPTVPTSVSLLARARKWRRRSSPTTSGSPSWLSLAGSP